MSQHRPFEIPSCSIPLQVVDCAPLAKSNNCAVTVNSTTRLSGVTWTKSLSAGANYQFAIVFSGLVPERNILEGTSNCGAPEYVATTGASCAPPEFSTCANPTKLSFNSFPAGTEIIDQFLTDNVRISATNNNTSHPDKAIVFDSSNPTGGDFDLMTPNPLGVGNTTSMENVLIIAEDDVDANSDGLVDDPDDEGSGGNITFRFEDAAGNSFPAMLGTLAVLDIENPGTDIIVHLTDGTTTTIPARGIGDKSKQTANLGNVLATKLEVDFNTSGAIDDLEVCLPCLQDRDGDGTNDCDDNCPTDSSKIAVGLCGCGVADTDSDGDGTPDCNDTCPVDPTKTEPGVCGCGQAPIEGTTTCADICTEEIDQCDVCGGDGSSCVECNTADFSHSQFEGDQNLKALMKTVRQRLLGKELRTLKKAGLLSAKKRKQIQGEKDLVFSTYELGWQNIWKIRSDITSCNEKADLLCTTSSNEPYLNIFFNSADELLKFAKRYAKRYKRSLRRSGKSRKAAKKTAGRAMKSIQKYYDIAVTAGREIPLASFNCEP